MTEARVVPDLVLRSDDPARLAMVSDPACALAIWDRELRAEVAATVDGLNLEAVDDIGGAVPVHSATLHTAVLLGTAGYERSDAVCLATEIGALIDRFAGIALCERVQLRLEVVETDACRRFHADLVTLRLLCTLRGAGTQWIAASAPGAISQVPTGTVALFKGRLLAEDAPILHRSPPIADAGRPRLLLVIDPMMGEAAA